MTRFTYKGVQVWEDEHLHAYLTVDSPVWIGMDKALKSGAKEEPFWTQYKSKADAAILDAVKEYANRHR
jgi:hypothetical protein